jgi:hypothetical protein
MEDYVELVVQLHTFLTSELGGDDWSSSCPGRFILWVGGCVYGSLNAVEKRELSAPPGNRTTISRSSTAIHLLTEVSRLPLLVYSYNYHYYQCT